LAIRGSTNFGSKGAQQLYDSSAAFDLKFLNELVAGGVGTSNPRHEFRHARIAHKMPSKINRQFANFGQLDAMKNPKLPR
jgi:hypothetical protein